MDGDGETYVFLLSLDGDCEADLPATARIRNA